MSSFAYTDFPLVQYILERLLIVTRIFQTTLQGNGQRDETDVCSVGSRPLPVALESCLENARHDERALKDQLTNGKSV